MSKVLFQIEWGSEPLMGIVFAKLIGDVQFEVFDDSMLGGIPILPELNMPRAINDDGKPRMDLFAFRVCNKKDLAKFQIGETVELIRSQAKD